MLQPFLLCESMEFVDLHEVAIDEAARIGNVEEEDCAICLEPMFKTKIVDTPCHHSFHFHCIE
jgi:hypothetical protein